MTLSVALPAEWEDLHPQRRRCDVYRVHGSADCDGESAAWFTATCGHGHVMEGGACSPCKNALKLGCGSCWEDGTGYQRVTITWEAMEMVDA